MQHFKDAKPLDTVKKIMRILDDIGLEVEHYEIYSGVKNVFSYRVEIKGSNGVYGTNGKGISREYAMASAYAEFLERMQNNLLFSAIRGDQGNEHGFYYSIDEREFDIVDLANLEADFLGKIIADIGEDVSVIEHLQNWNFLYPNPDKIIAFPFQDIANDTIHYIPIHILKIFTGSNGMCAGNSKEEALIQGISEILERHVVKQLMSESLTMPRIPESEIIKQKHVFEIVSEFREKTGFEMNFYDASLGKGLPVVACICIDKHQKKYHVHFGAHPIFSIALERSITELLQGQNIKNMYNFIDFSFRTCSTSSSMRNIVQMYVNNIAYSPLQFFQDQASYSYKPFADIDCSSNKAILQYLLSLLKTSDLQMLYRDTSFSGFNSYSIYIHELSIYKYDKADIKLCSLLKKHHQLFKSIRNIHNANSKTLKQILNLLLLFEKYNIRQRYRLISNSFLDMQNNFKIADTSLIIICLHLHLGLINDAYKYISTLDSKEKLTEQLKVIQEYLGGLRLGYKHNDILEVLNVFYFKKELNILSKINDDSIITLLPNTNCFDCQNCSYTKTCIYDLTKKCRDKYFKYLSQRKEV